ncbi:MAG: hypothetical protein OXU23_11105 [Candidatus Poribacteria bacterium]|nr:hypothetical protein [Candidatus Poribacteria bacterium]
MENPKNVIINCLKALRTRSHIKIIFQKVTRVFFFAMCFLAVLYVGNRLILFSFSISLITFLVVIGAVVFGICLGIRHRPTLSDTAGFVDERLELKERASTSLELIQENREDELAQLQIRDTAEGIRNIDFAKIIPYTPPRLLKWASIPLLIIGLSFTVPRQYELPQPPTTAEREAIEKTIGNLSAKLENVQDPIVQDEIRKTIKQLKNVKDVASAQEHLRSLSKKVQQKKSEFPAESAIAHATQATQYFNGMDATTLTDELERLARQTELTPELRAELTKLFEKMAENFSQGELSRALDHVQGKVVSPDTLQEIVDALKKLNKLNQLEAQLTESRKDIALAGIETNQPAGGVANSDGATGRESGKQETQGTQVTSGPSDITPSDNGTTPSVDKNATEKPLTGDTAPSSEIAGNELKINSETASNTQNITKVFTEKAGTAGTEPDYLPFSDVVLSAQREYAQAIENNRIPVRYRSQIKAYLEAIAKIDEK